MSTVFSYIKGLQATHLIDVGTKLGIFRHLVAAQAGLSPRFVS